MRLILWLLLFFRPALILIFILRGLGLLRLILGLASPLVRLLLLSSSAHFRLSLRLARLMLRFLFYIVRLIFGFVPRAFQLSRRARLGLLEFVLKMIM